MSPALSRGALAERDRELARLAGRLGEARAGDGGLTVIEGPPGIGKTSLVEAARRHAAALDMRVLHARGSEQEREFAYGILRQALTPALAGLSDAERTTATAGAAAHAGPLLSPDRPATSVEALLYGVYWLLGNLGELSPLLLAVDDAHWADEASVAALAFLARRVEHLPLAIVVATRPPEPDGSAALAALVSDPTAERLRPGALGAGAIAAISGSDDPAFTDAALTATGGNPFLLEQLLRELGPDRTAVAVAVIEPRELGRIVLARLSERARAFARALLIIGDGATPSECGALAQVDGAADAVDELVGAGVFVDDGALRFRHPLLAAAVATGLPASRREEWHARAAALLRARGADAERLAVHIAAAAPAEDPAVVDILVAAAERARARGAPAAAEAPLRRALVEPPEPARRPAILLALGEALSQGSEAAAAEAFAQAARTSTDPELRTRAFEARARVLWAGPPAGVDADLAEIDAVIASLPPDAGGLRSRLEAARLAVAQRSAAAMPDAIERAERSGLFAAGGSEHPNALAHAALWLMHCGQDADRCAELALRATRAAASAGAYHATPPGLWFPFTTIVLQAAERLAEARASARALQDATRENGSATWYALTTQWHARLLADAGDLHAAEEEARLAVDVVTATERWMQALPVRTLAAVLLDRGRPDAAATAWQTLGLAEEIPDARPLTELLLTRARLRASRGDLAGAGVDATEAARRSGLSGPASMNDQEARLLVARLALADGDRAAARAAVTTAVAVAEAWGTDGAIGAALRLRGNIEQSVELLRDAVRRLEDSPLRLEHARALADLGGALRRANHRLEAREPLGAALELARACGADGVATSVAEELAATGAHVPSRPRGGIDALTPTERRITRLAAERNTNKEIAQALFISVKTVEMHLGNAYRKLDITSRRELPAALPPRSRTVS